MGNMNNNILRTIPSLYLANYLNDFEDLLAKYNIVKKAYKKGEVLTQCGAISETAYYVKNGIMHLSIGHEEGEKSICLFGQGTIFPIGVEHRKFKMDYEMIIRAFSDLEVYSMSYQTLKKVAEENGRFTGELLRENCDFVGYMFLDSVNQTFEPCLSRICDILYLYLINVQPNEDKIPLTQSKLANLASASRAQMERSLKILRKEQTIETARGYIKVLNRKKLFTYCTQGVHENI